MTNKSIAIIGISSILIIFVSARYFLNSSKVSQPIGSFEECVAQGNPILEIYPEQCKTKDGTTFTKQYSSTSSPALVTSSPATTATKLPQSTKSKKTYQGKLITFTHPDAWNPKESPLEPGATKESVNLGIPEVHSDQIISFFSVPFDQIQPLDSIEQKEITIAGQVGKKWIRHGEGYYTYAYYTKDPKSEGSFGISVTTPDRDIELEQELDELVTTIKWR